MKKRYQYALLFGAPGFFLSLVIASLFFGAAAGFLWLFVFGDTPWPEASGKVVTLLSGLTFLALWSVSVVSGYLTGKKFEAEPQCNKMHLLASAGLTMAPILFIVLHQLSVGNLGPKSAGQLCGDFCRQRGHATSGLPAQNSGERSCLCFDDSGLEVLTVPIDTLAPGE